MLAEPASPSAPKAVGTNCVPDKTIGCASIGPIDRVAWDRPRTVSTTRANTSSARNAPVIKALVRIFNTPQSVVNTTDASAAHESDIGPNTGAR